MKDRVRLALEALAEMSTPRALDLMVESLRQRRHAKIYPNLYRAIARKLSRLEPEDASRLPEVTYRHLARFVRLERRVENGHDGSLELCLAFCEGLERWNPEPQTGEASRRCCTVHLRPPATDCSRPLGR
jgi:hypothetical protein